MNTIGNSMVPAAPDPSDVVRVSAGPLHAPVASVVEVLGMEVEVVVLVDGVEVVDVEVVEEEVAWRRW